MKRTLLVFCVTFIIMFSLAYGFLVLQTDEPIPGALSTDLPGSCELIKFGRALQPVVTIAMACPGVDMIRLWPLPVQQPWFEDHDPCYGFWEKCVDL